MTVGTEKSRKMTVPKRPRRESSTTALKAAAKTRGFNYPHKGSSAGTHGQRWEAWKTAGSCGEGKQCIVPMISVGKHGIPQRAVV